VGTGKISVKYKNIGGCEIGETLIGIPGYLKHCLHTLTGPRSMLRVVLQLTFTTAEYAGYCNMQINLSKHVFFIQDMSYRIFDEDFSSEHGTWMMMMMITH
jgi:hypothetical protein